jgi:23S rRNA pseudouridine1911/1915/1917 synthase
MSARSERFTIEQTLPNERFDTYLRGRYPAMSRGAIQRLIDLGHIRVNGEEVKLTHRPRAGEEVTVHWPEPGVSEVKPEKIALHVLYEDKDLLIINKAPGIVVHPSVGHERGTLVNALLHHCKGQLSGIGGIERPGIVHRLDIDTSGCLVVAKNDLAHVNLQKQFSGRTMEKIYLAIVCGVIERPAGEIRANIERHPSHRKRMTVTPDMGGREARTEYSVKQRLKNATLVEVVLHTGRTHQIRVHFQHLGYPVLGDLTYGKRQTQRVTENTGVAPPRIMLHAWKLSFAHPSTERVMSFEAPIPTDMNKTVRALKAVCHSQS